LTGDQKHNDHITTVQRVSRPDVFYFFSTTHFLKTILASRTSGTFAFAPARKAYPSAKAKEPIFPITPTELLTLKSILKEFI
jgi:hypothetical protein